MNVDKNTGLLIIGDQGGSSGGGGGAIDLSFITAGSGDILSGKVGADTEGNPVYGSLVPASGGGMDFYKCAAVYGPRTVTRIRVEGAGTAKANGDYVDSGKTNEGNPVYTNGECFLYSYYGMYGITDLPDYYGEAEALYYRYDSIEGEWNSNMGAPPTPIVSKVTVAVDEDVPKTWDGYKAVFTDNGYVFEETLTTGLSYGSAFTPEVNGVYSADCAIAVDYLYSNFPLDYLFFDALNSADGWTFSGAEVVQDGSRNVFQTSGGSSYAVLNTDPGVPLASSPRTMSHWFKRTADCPSSWCGIGYGKSGNNSRFTWGLRGNYSIITLWGDDNFQTQNGLINDDEWHHFLTTYDGVDKVVQYLDGKKIWEWSTGTTSTAWQYIHVGDPWERYACNGRFADFYIYDRVLRDYEIQQLFEAKTVGE